MHYLDAVEVSKIRTVLWKQENRLLSTSHVHVTCSSIDLDFPQVIRTRQHYLAQVLKKAKLEDQKAFLQKDELVYKGKSYTSVRRKPPDKSPPPPTPRWSAWGVQKLPPPTKAPCSVGLKPPPFGMTKLPSNKRNINFIS